MGKFHHVKYNKDTTFRLQISHALLCYIKTTIYYLVTVYILCTLNFIVVIKCYFNMASVSISFLKPTWPRSFPSAFTSQ